MEKILYKKEGVEGSKFGEFEVDYVYLGKLQEKAKYNAVQHEIADLAWVSRDELPIFMSKILSEGGYFSPWFLKMQESGMLEKWWKMVEKGNLKDCEGELDDKVTNML